MMCDERREAAIERVAQAIAANEERAWDTLDRGERETLVSNAEAAYDAALGGEAEKGPQWTLLFDGQRWSVYEVFRAGRLIRAGERGESLVDILKHSHAGNAWHLHTSIVQRSMAAAPNEQEGE